MARREVNLSTIKRLMARHRPDAEDDRARQVSPAYPRSIYLVQRLAAIVRAENPVTAYAVRKLSHDLSSTGLYDPRTGR